MDDQYFDVKDTMPDLQGKYHTLVPDKVGMNQFDMDHRNFIRFRNAHLKTKKNLELRLIKENKKLEIQKEIFDLMEPKPRVQRMQSRREFLQMLTKKIIHKESARMRK